MENAVVYARFSSHKQGEQSIEGQIAAAKKYAKDHDLNIIHEYVDRAVSGRTDDRKDFQKMLRDTAKHQFSVIILWKIDRFGRNREEIAFNKHRCTKNGVRIVRIAEAIPDGPEGVILDSVLEGMAEYYSLQLSQNVSRGLRASAEKAQSVGGRHPLGYKVENKKYVIDENTAPAVRYIFQSYADGVPAVEIIHQINAMGLRTLQGKEFTRSSIESVLRNRKYIGVYSYKDVEIENAIPPIVDRETFDKVQAMRTHNKRHPNKKWDTADYILTGKLFCGICGAEMQGESGKSRNGSKYSYYSCYNRKRHHSCSKKPVRQDAIEAVVIDVVLSILQDDDTLDFIVNAVWDYYQSEKSNNDVSDALQKNLAQIKKAKANIAKAVEVGLFDTSLIARMDELNAQQAEIEAQLQADEMAKAWQITKPYIQAFLKSFRDKDITNRDVQKQLIDTFVNSVFVYDDGTVKITFNYSDGDPRTITLDDLKKAEENAEVFDTFSQSSTIARTVEPFSVQIYRNVFVVTVQI